MNTLIRKIMGGSMSAIAVVLLGAFGLFWLGIALHWALVPVVGIVWAWVIPGGLYLGLALIAAAVALRSAAPAQPAESESIESAPLQSIAGQLGLELGRGLEREVRRHPLRSVSVAMLGGAVLGASPELRRGLRELIGDETGSRHGRGKGHRGRF